MPLVAAGLQAELIDIYEKGPKGKSFSSNSRIKN